VEKEVIVEESNASEDFSFDLTDDTVKSEEKSETVVHQVEVSSDSSMNDILSGTIAKLVARQEIIATDRSGKATKEEEIKVQIKDLQAQVKELEEEMSALDSESDKITANIAELENMKLDPVKQHNAKRVTKK
jgi:chromosome segregation ATPase